MDRLKYAVDIPVDVVIPEPQNRIAKSIQGRASRAVSLLFSVPIVLTAIHFNNESRLATLEVGDEAFNGRLPAKMKSKFAKVSQSRPKPDLLSGH